MQSNDATLPLDLVVALWKLGQSELNREQGKKTQSEELMIIRVAELAKEWVREQLKVNAHDTNASKSTKPSEDSHVRMNQVRPGEYRKVFIK